MTLRTRLLLTLTMTTLIVVISVWLFEPLWSFFGIVLFIFGFVFLVNHLLSIWITEPIIKLSEAAHAVQAGKYQTKNLESIIKRPDDVGELGVVFDQMARMVVDRDKRLELLKIIIPMGVRLAAEKDFDRLLTMMVVEAQRITNADGGTLYLQENDHLRFVVVRNNSLNIAMGGCTGKKISFKPLPLYHGDGSPNIANIATYIIHKKERVHIADAYHAKGFDFSGTKHFDESTGYRSKSFLAFPLEGDNGEVIGVLQLINALDEETREIIPFASDEVVDSLALLASAALAGYIRAEELRQEINKLRIEIDQTKRHKQVEEITDTDYFKELQVKAREARMQKGYKGK